MKEVRANKSCIEKVAEASKVTYIPLIITTIPSVGLGYSAAQPVMIASSSF